MSMTREEAILLSAYTGFLFAPDFSEVHKFCEDTLGRPIWTHEFADICVQKEIQEKLRPQIMELVQNIAALRPVSRERVERVWRGEWIVGEPNGLGFPIHCSRCGWGSDHADPRKWMDYGGHIFCGRCGAPMTDEAVDILLKRLEALKDGKGI